MASFKTSPEDARPTGYLQIVKSVCLSKANLRVVTANI